MSDYIFDDVVRESLKDLLVFVMLAVFILFWATVVHGVFQKPKK